MTSKTRKLINAMLLCGLVGSAQSAFSATTVLDYIGPAYGPYAKVNIAFDDGPGGYPTKNLSNQALGGFNTLNTTANPDQSLITWCVDIFDTLNTGPTTYNNGNASSINNFAKLQDLANRNYSKVNNSVTSAAFQLAVWEIVNETAGSSSFDLTTGQFTATAGSSAVIALASDWLGLDEAVTGNYNIAYFMIDNGTMPNGVSQNLISMSPVPLPAAGLLMLSALGLGGLVTRRRKASKQ